MSDITTLKNAIIEQATQEGQAMLASASAQIEADFQTQKTKLLSDLESKRDRQLKELDLRFQVDKQQLKHQEHQTLLAVKQEAIRELFEATAVAMAGLSHQEELALVTRLLQAYKDQAIQVTFGELTKAKLGQEGLAKLQEQFPTASMAETVIANQAGFVVSVGQVDDNYLYRDLLASVFKTERTLIATVLFNEN
ncbi:hypothetical protein ACVRWQ_03695 [Streptococcus phocae subsp. salmonis]